MALIFGVDIFQEKIHQASAAAARAKKMQKPKVTRQPVGELLAVLLNTYQLIRLV